MALRCPCDERSRDDLRTRSGAAGIRRGSGSESRERREDGADDHPTGALGKLGSLCWGSVRRKHSLPRRSRIRRDYGDLGPRRH